MQEDFAFLDQYARKLAEPDNLFSGLHLPENFSLPDNILVFFHDYTALAPNAHGRHTLVIPLDRMTYYLGRSRIELAPGVLLYVPPFVMRFLHPDSPGYRRLFITFEVALPQKYLPQAGLFFLNDAALPPLKKFLGHYRQSAPAHSAFSLMELLQHLESAEQTVPEAKLLPESIERAILFIENDLSKTGGIADAARAAGLSESRLRTLFRESVGLPLGKFIIAKKLDLAKYLLLNSRCSAAKIARQCGFANIFVFSTFFKRHTGLPPLRFRRQGTETELEKERERVTL